MKQVIDILKLKTNQDIDEVANHNLRKVPSRNVNPKKSYLNRYFIGSPGMDVIQELAKKLENVPKFRKDANKMVNLVLSASPEFYQTATKKQITDWENDSQKWAEDYFGKENIVYSLIHKDEKTPHFHIAIVPIFEGKLRSNHWFDGPIKLNALHNSYAKVSKKYGIERGQKAIKSNQTELENFYKKVNASTQYERELDKKLDVLFEKLEKPTFLEKINTKSFVDSLVKPFVSQLNKNLSHYRTRSKESEKERKELKLANEKIADLELKMETLGISPKFTFIQCQEISNKVKTAIAENSVFPKDVFEVKEEQAKQEVHQVVKNSSPKIR